MGDAIDNTVRLVHSNTFVTRRDSSVHVAGRQIQTRVNARSLVICDHFTASTNVIPAKAGTQAGFSGFCIWLKL